MLLQKIKDQVNQVRLKGHLMENAEEYKKELYVTTLSGFALAWGYDEKKEMFLKSLVKSFGLENNGKYIKKAKTIDNEFFRETAKNFKDNKYGDMLLFDALMLCSLNNEINEKDIELASKLFALFEKDEKQVIEIKNKAELIIGNIKTIESYPEIYNMIICNQDIIIDKETSYDKDTYFLNCKIALKNYSSMVFNSCNAKFVNCSVLNPANLQFNNCKSVEIRDSRFYDGEGRIYIKNNETDKCEKILIVNNVFSKLEKSNSLFFVNNAEEIFINNNTFEECSSSYNYDSFFFDFRSINNSEISGNTFKNCSSKCSSSRKSSFFNFSSINKSEVSKNTFENCSCSSYSDSYFFNFSSINKSEINGNTFENCSFSRSSSRSSSSSSFFNFSSINKSEVSKNTFENCSFSRSSSDLFLAWGDRFFPFFKFSSISNLNMDSNTLEKCKAGYCFDLNEIKGKITNTKISDCVWEIDDKRIYYCDDLIFED